MFNVIQNLNVYKFILFNVYNIFLLIYRYEQF